MACTKRRLITFGRSHFCEKARWALDWHGIAYDEIGWPPGLHIILAKRRGATATTLPILLDGESVIQGSGAIIDWAESKSQDCARSLTPRSNQAEAQEIERRADQVIGVHVRRLAYAETLPSHSHLVKPSLFLRASGWHRLIGNMMWPVVRRLMIRIMTSSQEPPPRAERSQTANSTGSTANSPMAAPIWRGTGAAAWTSPWRAYWLGLPCQRAEVPARRGGCRIEGRRNCLATTYRVLAGALQRPSRPDASSARRSASELSDAGDGGER